MSAEVRIGDNPLLVLGLEPGVTRMEVERQAQLLLGMLELGFGDAATYATSIGPRPRTADGVRAAAAALRDPSQRLQAELWFVPAAAPADPVVSEVRTPEASAAESATGTSSDFRTSITWAGALAHLGWGPSRGAS